MIHHLEFYTEEELAEIICNSAKILDVEIEPEGAIELAKRSRGTPRLANRLLKRVRDFAQVKYDGKITRETASFALDLLEVDTYGLDVTDRNLLTTMIEKFQGGPVGLAIPVEVRYTDCIRMRRKCYVSEKPDTSGH